MRLLLSKTKEPFRDELFLSQGVTGGSRSSIFGAFQLQRSGTKITSKTRLEPEDMFQTA
jgi:hypothetical protein